MVFICVTTLSPLDGGGGLGIVLYEKSLTQNQTNDPLKTSNPASMPKGPRNWGKIALHPKIVLVFALASSQIDKLSASSFIYALQWSQILFFAYGIMLAFCMNHIALIQKHYKWTFPVSLVSFTLFLILTAVGNTGGYLLILKSIGARYLSYSLIGFTFKNLNHTSSTLQYLSKASMAIYILHLPYQIIVGYFLLPIPFNPYLKMIVLTLIVYALSFASYEGIRRTNLKS